MKKNFIILLFLILISFTIPLAAEDIPPTFALATVNINTINPVGYWDSAFSPSWHVAIDLQYPTKLMNLYLGGKIEFTQLGGQTYRDVTLQLFSLNFVGTYKILDFETGFFYTGGGLGVNFEEIQSGDAQEDAVLGSVKLDFGVRKRIEESWLLTVNLNYTYIPDSPYLTLGFGITYFFDKFNK